MVATGVADRPRERIAKLIYIDAFVPQNGQSLFDFLPEQARPGKGGEAQGDGGLIPGLPTPCWR